MERKHQEIQTANGIVRSTKEELGTSLNVKFVDDSLSVLSPRQLFERQEGHHVLYRQFRSSHRGHSAESLSIKQAGPAKGNPVPDEEVEETVVAPSPDCPGESAEDAAEPWTG